LVGGIYLRQGDEFVPMREQRYEAESVLQALIADHPDVLAGDEQGAARAWLLVKREAGIADSAATGDRFSLDHLFLDQDGVPTLVEVKRSSDTRARREVVAQMLDYAANATAYWKVESLRAWFETECERQGRESLSVLATAFGISDEDDYWRTVQRNLAADRIRLVFVGDETAPELRSIVEFLNRQLTDTKVLVIEVKQYVDADGKRQTIVPRLLGQTEEAKAAKSGAGRPTRQWDRDSLLAELARRDGERTASIARSLIDWADGRDGVRVLYGQGARSGSAQIRLGDDGALLTAFNVWSYGAVEIHFDHDQRFPTEWLTDSLWEQPRNARRASAPHQRCRPGGEHPLRRRPAQALALLRSPTRMSGTHSSLRWSGRSTKLGRRPRTPDLVPASHETRPSVITRSVRPPVPPSSKPSTVELRCCKSSISLMCWST
jgi:hypothetical protein